MSQPENNPLIEARQLVQRLRQLDSAAAPASLLAGCLERIGLGDAYAVLETTIGRLFVAYNDLGISAVMQASDADEFVQVFRLKFQRPIRPETTLPDALAQALIAQLSGRPSPDLRFDLRGLSEFERAVLLKALEIPRGEVRPYTWIAREIGRPKAVRAVGSALGSNPIPVLIPCHRVVRSDGRIGEYIFGSSNKRKLLDNEGADPELLEQLGRSGVRYLGDTSERMFCLPTCGGMHHRTDNKIVSFRSDKEALGAGFQPCNSCRPPVST
jgi:O-6-methylguanine DNA methyltransferase